LSSILTSCCDDCGGFIPPLPAEPCPNVYRAVSLSEDAKSLPPFIDTDSMVFKHRLGGILVYRLDSMVSDSTHYGCDTLIAQENIWAQYSTQTKLPAQPTLLFKLRKSDYSDSTSREIFSIESGVNFSTTVFIDNFEKLNRDNKSTFHEKIINCDTAFYNVYDLSSYGTGYGGYRNVYYSKEKGVEALIGGPNSWDYFVRVY
ncbi:MAG: hypothetical protein KJP21_06785, partial [Bacteroidia bacterium]|nr:hypothetical protein [Bacteroidia bacterium]